MSLVNITNVRHYWCPTLGNDLVKETMTVNKFEKIRQTIHFNDNSLISMVPNRDKLYNIRPVIETLRKRFLTVPLEENLSVDEQLCSTKARSALKVYLPNKPHKWGYKFCILCGASGFAYNFEVCSGQENQECFRLKKEPDLGASFNIVVNINPIVNSWLLHRRIQESKGENKTMTLVQFRKELAISLCKVGQVITPKRGRPSKEIENNIEKKRKLGTKKKEK